MTCGFNVPLPWFMNTPTQSVVELVTATSPQPSPLRSVITTVFPVLPVEYEPPLKVPSPAPRITRIA